MTMIGIGVGVGFGGNVAPWTPLAASPLLWVRADRGVTLNGTDVSTWADLSGNGKDFTEATPAKQPAYNVGALPSVELVLAKQMNTVATLDLTGGYSALAVIEWGAIVGGLFALVGGGVTRAEISDNLDGKTYCTHSGFGVGVANAGGIAVVDFDYDGTDTIRERINGSGYASADTVADPTTSTLGLGYAGYSANVKWYELAIFTPKLSATDQGRLTAYARGRYGV